MMQARHLLACFFLIVAAISFGCSETEEITQLEGFNKNENSPSIANIQNSFSINVTANSYNAALEYPIDFDKLSLNIALSIDNLSLGDVTIQVFNNTKQMLYTADFKQKSSFASTITLEEKPTKIKFIFNNLSANFSCAITAN